LNIYQKLVEVRKSVPYLKKEAQGSQYNYTGSSQVLAAVRSKMDDLGLVLIPSITDKELHLSSIEYFDKEGRPNKRTTTYFTEIKMTMTWVNADNPEEKFSVPWYAQGVDIAGEKGVGKALTYGEKYFMLKTFNIATDKDDPDSFQEKAQSYSKPDGISQQTLIMLCQKVDRFAELRKKKGEDVFKALKFSDPKKLSETQGLQHIEQLNEWITKAEQEVK
jgi:hypothetical protein